MDQESKVHIIVGRKTSHAKARRLAEEMGVPIRYFPYWPKAESHVVYPPKKPTRR
jgi:hypothetical protein